MKPLLLALCLGALPLSAASADETIKTGAATPPATSPEVEPLSTADALRPAQEDRSTRPEDPARADCTARQGPPDQKARGEMWGAVGAGGYRSVGGGVTQPGRSLRQRDGRGQPDRRRRLAAKPAIV